METVKVRKLGDVIQYGSVQHWLAYYICEYNISSKKGGKPNAALCAFMEINGKFKIKNIFLQHGVSINNLRWLNADRSNIYKFITSTVDEDAYIKSNFGYPNGTIVRTGLLRFDGLHDNKIKKNQIVVIPTWRYWFNLKSKQSSETDDKYEKSEYLMRWNEFLSPQRLKQLCDEGLTVVFYLQRNLQRYSDLFKIEHSNITIASWEDYDIQLLLRESELLITDYSSLFFDMIYMKNPVLFYQFDEEKYREHQYGKRYFNYYNNPFGKSFSTHRDVIEELAEKKRNGFCISEVYKTEHKRLFPYYDDRSSERIYKMLVSDYAENK